MPEIFSHNVECVERISKQARAQSVWSRSINVLKSSVEFGLRTKLNNGWSWRNTK